MISILCVDSTFYFYFYNIRCIVKYVCGTEAKLIRVGESCACVSPVTLS